MTQASRAKAQETKWRGGDKWRRLSFADETLPGRGIRELLDLVLGWAPGIDNEDTVRLSSKLDDADGVDTGYDVRREVDGTVLGALAHP